MKIINDSNSNTRRKLLYWGAGMLSALVFWPFVKKEEKKEKPVKMFSEDGQLVEVDPRYLSSMGRKIEPGEIHTWVKSKK